MRDTKRLPLSPQEIRQASVIAVCDPRCVVRVLFGLPVRSTTAARVRSALEQLGLGDHMPTHATLPRRHASAGEGRAPCEHHDLTNCSDGITQVCAICGEHLEIGGAT